MMATTTSKYLSITITNLCGVWWEKQLHITGVYPYLGWFIATYRQQMVDYWGWFIGTFRSFISEAVVPQMVIPKNNQKSQKYAVSIKSINEPSLNNVVGCSKSVIHKPSNSYWGSRVESQDIQATRHAFAAILEDSSVIAWGHLVARRIRVWLKQEPSKSLDGNCLPPHTFGQAPAI